MNPYTVSLAPQWLQQSILPWSFNADQIGLINIDLGLTAEPQTEREILDRVGSYGKQLGRVGDALEVLLKHVDLSGLSDDEADVIDELQGQLAAVRRVKRRQRREQAE